MPKKIYTHIHICCFGLFRFIRLFKMPQCVACVHREREIYIYKHTHVYMWFHLHVPTSTCACSPPLSGCSSGRREAGASRLFFQILQFEPLPCDSTHPSAAFACARNDTFRPPPRPTIERIPRHASSKVQCRHLSLHQKVF